MMVAWFLLRQLMPDPRGALLSVGGDTELASDMHVRLADRGYL
jgi:hypothetical protein